MRLLLIILLQILTLQAFAGWYECYTYKGQVAGVNVKVYIQLREINANSKDSIPVSGTYKYENINEPIVLEGYLINNKSLELIEYHDNIAFAKLTLQWGNKSLNGQWKSDQKNHKIILTETGRLIDTEREMVNNPTEILMSSSFREEYIVGVYYKREEYIVGVYYKREEDYRARISELKIIDKKTNQVRHTIKFKNEDSPVGNVMTIIFKNVTAWKKTDNSEKAIEIVEDDGRMGQSFFMTYNSKTNTFIKDGTRD